MNTTDKFHAILKAIEQRAGIESIYDDIYIFNTTKSKYYDIIELLDVLNILRTEERCDGMEISYIDIDNKTIVVGYLEG